MKDLLSKSLEEIETEYWGTPPNDASTLIKKTYSLRKKQLTNFEVEDLRLMIGQNMSLDYLVPLAIQFLKKNPFVEGDYYEGDLFEKILKCDHDFWKRNPKLFEDMKTIVELALSQINEIDIIDKIKESILNSINQFQITK